MTVVLTRYAGEDLGTLKTGDTFLVSDSNAAVYQVVDEDFSEDATRCVVWHSGATTSLKKTAVVIPVDVEVTVRPRAFDS